jgi:hypothetical protein
MSWQPQKVKWECLLFEKWKNKIKIKFSPKKDLGKIHHISTELFIYLFIFPIFQVINNIQNH